jgi:signal peptidase II
MESAPTRQASRPRLAIRPKDGWFLLAALAIVGLDQLVKWIIRETVERGETHNVLGPLDIVHVTNSGAAFGIFQGAGLFNPGFAHPLMRLGLAVMLGGAVGNLIDRVKDGEVVDFIKVPNWPAFNVADSAITIGVLLLAWAMIREPQPPQHEA